MTTSPSQPAPPSSSRSNGASGASLPQWRLWLQMLNWRRDPDVEQKINASRLRTKQFESEINGSKQRTKQIERETEQLKNENARLAAIESRLAHFEREHLSNSSPLSSTDDSSLL